MSSPLDSHGGEKDLEVEKMHRADPLDWSWNESWLFSWVDADGGPAGLFRIGITPNQKRAMLWSFVHIGETWYTIEESRLASDHFELSNGVAYDRWGLRFDWAPNRPLRDGRFTCAGYALARSGPNTGARIPIAIELEYRDAADVHGSSIAEDADLTSHPVGRFEQSLEAAGTVQVGERIHQVHGGAHRDKSWGPRDWRKAFAMGDLQGRDRQLYFVGRSFPGVAMGYVREGSRDLVPLTIGDAQIDYDDAGRTITRAQLDFRRPDGSALDVVMTPLSPSISFDIAHTCAEPQHWLYWRTLVEATVSDWDGPVRGWFESSRFGSG